MCESVSKKDFTVPKDKRMTILYAVPISPWPMLGKENSFFYTRHSNNNDCTKIISLAVAPKIKVLLSEDPLAAWLRRRRRIREKERRFSLVRFGRKVRYE